MTVSQKRSRSTAPGYKVTVGSRTFEQPERDGLEVLVVEDHVDMVDMLTLRASASEAAPKWEFNIADAVEAHVGSGDAPLFAGEVTAIEPAYQVESPATTITVRALDHIHRLGRGRHTRYWENEAESAVVQLVGSECGLDVQVDDTGEKLPYILQRNETNVAFLKRLAARNNFVLRVANGKLTFQKASFQGATNTVALGENVNSIRMSFNSNDLVQQVVVRGWDIKEKKEIVGTATLSDVTRIGGGKLGAEVASAFGQSTAYITDVPVTSQAVANTLAKAELERISRQFCHGKATLQGNDQIRAGTVVEFKGVSPQYNGKYFVLATRHIISARTGYTTELSFCSNTYGS